MWEISGQILQKPEGKTVVGAAGRRRNDDNKIGLNQ
jgi:hypothetical protein